MKAKFVGNVANDSDTLKVCEIFGVTFFIGQSVDISHLTDAQKAKLAGNHHFLIEDEPPEQARKRTKGVAKSIEPAPEASEE